MANDREAEKKARNKARKKTAKAEAERAARSLDNVHVKVARRVEPKKKFKHEPTINAAILPRGAVPSLAEFMKDKGRQAPDNFLDNMILNFGNSSMPMNEIAEFTNLTVSEVEQRYKRLLRESNTFSSADMRLMMTQQLRQLINAMHNAAKAGSTEHAKIIVSAIERLNKMYELELQQTKVTVELVTTEQTTLIVGIVQMIVDKIFAIPEIQKAVKPETIDGTIISVLDEAAEYLNVAQDRQLTA